MTAYNHEQYIGTAIASVLASTFADFELLVVDDGSQDQTLAIARHYARTDRRMRVWTNATNLGDYPNRNKAASYATGRYLKYLDADDLLYPQSLATFVLYMDHHPEAALGISSYVVAHTSPFPLHFPPGAAFHYHFFTQGFLDCGPSGTIIRRETFAAQGGFSGKRIVGDTELWMKIAAAHPVIIVPPGLFFWRQHTGQESTAGEQRDVFLALTLPMIQEALQYPGVQLTAAEKQQVLGYFRRLTARKLLQRAVRSRQVKEAWTLYQRLPLSWANLWHAVAGPRWRGYAFHV
jgi:hypothetical protein